MRTPSSNSPGLRLWPGVLAAALILPVRFIVPMVWPDGVIYAMLVPVVLGLAVMVWWTFFSRAPRGERWGGLALMVVAIAVAWALAHVSISTGAMGVLLPMSAIPVIGFAFPIWAAASRGLSNAARRATMVATVLLACGVWTLVRTEGMTSTLIGSDLHWRWTPTAEERLLADPKMAPLVPAVASTRPMPAPAGTPAASPKEPPPADDHPAMDTANGIAAGETRTVRVAEWPGFRGPARDSIIGGVRIETDWTKTPPVALWRRPIGPGWSSFAVSGDRFYTQEQRGEDEIVSCYAVSTGEPIWAHRDPVRFWESNGGAGPRATPMLSRGRVYAFGATGILNALDADDGRLVWSRNVAVDSQINVPDWGFASSPLVVADLVVVAAAGKLMAYDAETGSPRWSGADDGAGYSSPHLVTMNGVPQIVLLTGRGAASVEPADGARLWEFIVPANSLAATIVQPAFTAEGDVLVGDGQAGGLRRISAAPRAGSARGGPGGWTVTERWNSNRLKPFFNDFVVHKGHAYGFDGTILASIDLVDGARRWKGGRYGNGQLLLLADQDLLLVTSEEGELALVEATAERFTEVARVPGIEGKTWNHPVLAGDVLLVRNGEEMAAFQLALISR